MALRSNYAKLHESHERVAEEQRREQERQTQLNQGTALRQQQEQQDHLEQEQRQQQAAPKNNYHQTLDANEDRQRRWAEAKLQDDPEAEAKIRQELADRGYRHNEITNEDQKADQLAQQQLAKQQEQQAKEQPDREARKQAFLAKRNGGPALEQDQHLDVDD